MIRLLRPSVGAKALRLGSSRKLFALCWLPLVIGVVCALTVGRSRLFHEYVCLVLGAVWTLLFLWKTWYLVYVDRSRLMIRNPLWKIVDLDRLAVVKAYPAAKNGPVLRLVDQSGAKCWVGATNMNRRNWAILCAELQPYATREGVRHEGAVRKFLINNAKLPDEI